MTATKYTVAITNASLGQQVGNPPYDGYIDPTPVSGYMTNTLRTGSTFGTVAAGQVVFINSYPVVLTDTTVASVAAAINATSSKHFAIAGTSGGNLTLINDPLHWMVPISVSDGTAGITAQLGFVSPTISTVAAPSTLAYSIAKSRGNWRWKILLEQIGLTGTINSISAVALTGVDLTFATNPTAIQFNVTVNNDQYYSYDFSGNLIYGATAIQYNVARALTTSETLLDVVFNPTNTIPTPPPTIAAGQSSLTVQVGALTASNTTALAAITVTALGNPG